MSHPKINRRTVLRGLGGFTVGLPLLEEMVTTRAHGAAIKDPVPVRAFNVFFGLGIPAPLQSEGFGGVLEPLEPLSDKLLIMRNVDQVRCDQSGLNAHFDGASGAFTATAPNGSAKSGGASIGRERIGRALSAMTTANGCLQSTERGLFGVWRQTKRSQGDVASKEGTIV